MKLFLRGKILEKEIKGEDSNNGGRCTISKLSNNISRNSIPRRKKDDCSKIIISNLEYKVTEKDLKVSLNSWVFRYYLYFRMKYESLNSN